MKKFGLAVITLISILLLAAAGSVYYVLLGEWHTAAYAAGKTNVVKVYAFKDEVSAEAGNAAEADAENVEADDENADASGTGDKTATSEASDQHVLVEVGSVIRGSEISKYRKTVKQDGVTYHKAAVTLADEDNSLIGEDDQNPDESPSDSEAGQATDSTEADSATSGAGEFINNLMREAGVISDEPVLYMAEESMADSREQTVLETETFVRTPATIYKEAGKPDIASFAPKGTRLEITGHDKLLANGYINMYKVAYEGADGKPAEGYVYGKYMTDTQEAADAPYNEHGEYDTAKKDKFSYNLYGGKATDLDLYPYEKTVIEGNEFCGKARAMYINAYAAVHPKQYVNLIKKSGCNAVVIDLKDGPLTYKSEVAKELSPKSYKAAYFTKEELKKGIDAYREAGVYLIGRIVTFNDSYYAKDHPEDCIKYNGSAGWPSAYSRDVWEYNVKLAQEAVREFGLNEIQFDYVRFPESTYEMSKSGKANFRNKYKESKAQAVQNFVFYAADQLRECGAYISIDVFGESAYSYVTAYGQYWTSISNIADAISAMPYTDHFSGDKPWENPYKSVRRWAKRAEKQQARLQNPAVARTWITGYDTPHWNPTIDYNEKRLRQQINALEKSGLDGGFIPWNAMSDIGKYKEYQGIWAAD